MSDDMKIYELITKLISDTINGRIIWNEKVSGNYDRSFVADYDNLYRLDFYVALPSGRGYRLRLLDCNGSELLEVDNIYSMMRNLYDVILSSRYGNDDKLDEAIEHILHK